MRISARCDYACKALLELAIHWPHNEPMQIHTISETQDIPMRYLVQILIQLKRLGIVKSVRGKEGGYCLGKPPSRITLGDVIRDVSGPLLPIANSSKMNGLVFNSIWDEVEGAMAKVLDNITFADIANRARGVNHAVDYQI